MATSLKTRATAKPTRQTRRVAPRRDFEGMKERRLRAADMFRRGKSQADVAAALEDVPPSVEVQRWPLR